jgi:predicted AlkP superfamily phosphohydrolase/phosphomutase
MASLVFIGIDGADWTLIEAGMKNGALTNISRIMNAGFKGTMRSTMPPTTYPAWTSMFTGVNPGSHGIIDFKVRIDGKFVFAHAGLRMTKSVWRQLSNQGHRLIIVNEPVTFPPEQVNGVFVSGFLVPQGARNFAHPSDVLQELDRVCGGYEFDLPLDYRRILTRDPEKGLQLADQFALKVSLATRHLMKTREWDLVATFFTSTDRLQHFMWHNPKALLKHYELIDREIGKILNDCADRHPTVMIVSDHGFRALQRDFQVNWWLASKGYAVLERRLLRHLVARLGITSFILRKVLGKARAVSLARLGTYKQLPRPLRNVIPRHSGAVLTVDPERSIAMFTGNAGIYLLKQEKGELIERMKRTLLMAKDGEHQIFADVRPRDEVVSGKYSHRAPDLYLLPADGFGMTGEITRPRQLVTPADGGFITTGTHRPQGIFLAAGTGVKQNGAARPEVRTFDIAPTILALLGCPIPSFVEGRSLSDVVETAAPELTRAMDDDGQPEESAVPPFNEADLEEINERLRSLGYI